MLIRYFDKKLHEIPDELAVKLLAGPSDDEDLLDIDTHWVNVIVHGALGTLFDPAESFEFNVEYALKKLPEPRPDAVEGALKLIKRYHIEIKDDDIGMFPAEDMI